MEPVYETLRGWHGELDGNMGREELPEGARRYLDRIEAIVGVPIEIVSVGPERTQTLVGSP